MNKYKIKRFSSLSQKSFAFRGYGRGILVGGAGGGVGTHMGGKAGMKALREGKDYEEAKDEAGKKGACSGCSCTSRH